jgi:hypothetical protein
LNVKGAAQTNNPRSYSTKLVKEICQPIKEKSNVFDADYINNDIIKLIISGNSQDITTLIDDITNHGNIALSADAIINYFHFR